MFVLPTICTLRRRAIARHAASFSAGLWVVAKDLRTGGRDFALHVDVILDREPELIAVWIRRPVVDESAIAGEFGVGRGKIEHPLHRTSEASTQLLPI